MKTVEMRVICMNQLVCFRTVPNKLGGIHSALRSIPVMARVLWRFGWKTKFTAKVQKSYDDGYIITIKPQFNH